MDADRAPPVRCPARGPTLCMRRLGPRAEAPGMQSKSAVSGL